LTTKLKADSYGDWYFEIRCIKTEHFESREKLDSLYIEESEREGDRECHNAQRTSLQKAMQVLDVDLSCNMEYYLNHRDQIEHDLNRQIDFNHELDSAENHTRLEQELLFKLLCRLFVPDDISNEDDISGISKYEKAFMLDDFRLLSSDGNDYFATAQRGDYFILFFARFC
jgi:hypothetical protein